MFLQYVATETRPGVFAFINTKKKRIYIGYSNTIIQTMVQISQELGNKTHYNKEMKKDLKQLTFSVLEYCSVQHGSAIKVKWTSNYLDQGYTLYNTNRVPEYKYRTVIVVTEADEFKVQVQLRSKGKRNYPVKDFATQLEADEFIRITPIYEAVKLCSML